MLMSIAAGVLRTAYKTVNAIHAPPNIRDHDALAVLTPHQGSPILAITVYMPQETNTLYSTVLDWIKDTITMQYPHLHILLGGDLQATISKRSFTSHYTLLHTFYTELGLQTPNDPLTSTFTPANTPIDHWWMRFPNT